MQDHGSNGTDRSPVPNTDICIVGAGPAGALVAYELSKRGYNVTVLEAGERFELGSRTERMERELRPSMPRESVWDMDEGRDAYTMSGEVRYPVNFNRAKGVGGSTLHWGGRVARFTEKDFEMNTRYGVASDWPISYADLKPYYSAAEREFGVAGTDDNPFAAPRDESFPMEAFPRSYSDSIFATACEKLDIEVHSVPNARNSEPYDGRSPCVGYGTCEPVCPSAAKYSADVHVEKAESHGAHVIAQAVVQRLEHDDTGSRVTGAVYKTPDGRTHTQRADQFVLAAGAIENARLLLLSQSPQYPNGLSNSSGAVGKYFMGHPYVGVTGRLTQPTSQHRIGFGTMETYEFYDPDDQPPRPFKIEFSNEGGPRVVELALDQRQPLANLQGVVGGSATLRDLQADSEPIEWGDDLLETIDETYGNWFSIVAEVEVLPNPNNRVTLNHEKTDTYGNPVPDVSWGHFTDYAEESMERAFETIEAIVDNLDVEVNSTERFELLNGVGHNSGTTRMGTDPDESVVDEHLQSHDLENLSITGSSTFVTLPPSQPTLTIAAISLRLADYLDRETL